MKNLLTGLVIGALSSSAFATTWTVDDDGKAHFDNIQDAVDNAAAGDEILVSPGTYTTQGDGEVIYTDGKELWIHSTDGALVTFLDGENERRVVKIDGSPLNDTVLEGFTIQNGYDDDGAGVYFNGTSTLLKNCIFTTNWSTARGGAVYHYNYVSGSAKITIEDCQFVSNHSVSSGGAVYSHSNSSARAIEFRNCEFTSNQALTSEYANGGAISTYSGSSSKPEYYLMNCVFTSNRSYADGGAIYSDNCELDLNYCDFISNNANDTNPSESPRAGAICLVSSDADIYRCDFIGNHAESSGGAVYSIDGSDVELRYCKFDDNWAIQGNGGGFYADSGIPYLYRCDFLYNKADNKGGGAYFVNCSEALVDIDYCNFYENRCGGSSGSQSGGGIYCSQSQLDITGCEIFKNFVQDNGAGIYFIASENSKMSNSVVCGNYPDQEYGTWIDGGGNEISEECGPCYDDSDGDGVYDCEDDCPEDPDKTDPGSCGCGVPDTDSDGDGTADCIDGCADDPDKTDPGSCGCGVPDTDSDGDGTADCIDGCADDPDKTTPGVCGCGNPDVDSDGDGILDCNDTNNGGPDPLVPGSLQVWIDDALDGDLITLAAGTYLPLWGDPVIETGSKSIHVIGGVDSDGQPTTILNSEYQARVVFVDGDSEQSVVLENLIFIHGYDDEGGGAYIRRTSTTFINCEFIQNAAQKGAGVYIRNSTSSFENCSWTNNGGSDGGAMYVRASDNISLSDCFTSSNSAARGGSIFIQLDSVVEVMGGLHTDNTNDFAYVDREGAILQTQDTVICGSGSEPIVIDNGEWTNLGNTCITEVCDENDDGDLDCIENNCPADLDGDGEVKVADLLLLIGVWGPCPGCDEDLDGDGEVKVADLLLLIAAWGACP